MSASNELGQGNRPATQQLTPVPRYLDARAAFATSYLFGEGIEIGPLHLPIALPAGARARYVDRMRIDDLRREYPELAEWDLTEVDIVDDGETLATIPAASLDFVIANHFLEHTEDPIGTITTHLGKLKPGGILFYAVPDKRFTFDHRRPVTPLEHLVADHEQGPERSRREHYDEWSELVIGDPGGSGAGGPGEQARELEAAAYSIHMHVWSQAEFLRLVLEVRERSGEAFDIEVSGRQGIEYIVVLRKRGALPEPAPPAFAAVNGSAHRRAASPDLRRRIRRALRAAKAELAPPRR